jgi:hypothetical protein
MVMLVLGIMTVHVPLPILARMPTDDCDSVEACGTCQCDPDGPVARQGSSEKLEAALSLKHSEPEIPDDEPCYHDGCDHCSLPCCGGGTVGIVPPTTSPDFPAAASVVPIASGTLSTIEVTDVFHPPARLIFLWYT